MNTEPERMLVRRFRFEEAYRLVSQNIGYVAWDGFWRSSAEERRVIVRTHAGLMREPVHEAWPGSIACTEMPLAHEAAAIARFRQHIRDQRAAGQVVNALRTGTASPYPVVDPVL